MGWDDFNDYDNDPVFGWDYIDYMNKTGIYEEPHDETDQDDELIMFGLDPDELEGMSDGERRAAIEDAGLDPNDYDFISAGSSGGRYQGNSTHRYNNNVSSAPRNTSSGKWSLLEFTIIITIIAAIGYTVAAFGGELLGTVVIIIVFIIIMSCF